MALKFDGQRLAELREARGRSRAWLADQLDVGEVNVARWEAGTEPSGVNALKLVHVLNVPPMDLLKEKEAEEDAAAAVPA